MKTTLLHTCCAPCAVRPIGYLQEQTISPTLFWYNPNIHPYTEYKARRESLITLAEQKGLNLVEHGGYGLRQFLELTHGQSKQERCNICYRLRLEQTAATAKELGLDCFTTSLLISPYQNHQLIKEIGQLYQDKYNIEFYYQDFRPLFKEGQLLARQSNFYMQKYCACIFSEEERYLKIKD